MHMSEVEHGTVTGHMG